MTARDLGDDSRIQSHPSIAVVIPVYRGANYLRGALDSLLNQTTAPDEIIIVDDGSPDDSHAIAQSYGTHIRVIRQDNRGMAAARNVGIRAAGSEWIALLDQDDICSKDRIEKTKEAIIGNPHARWVYSNYTKVSRERGSVCVRTPPPSVLAREVMFRCHVMPSFSAIRRDALLDIGGFPDDPKFKGVDDHILILRCMRRWGPQAFIHVDHKLCYYTEHVTNYSRDIEKHEVGRLAAIDEQLGELKGIRRAIWRQIMLAQIDFDLAVVLRENGDSSHLSRAIQSICRWPLPNRALTLRRYKIAAHMILCKLRVI